MQESNSSRIDNKNQKFWNTATKYTESVTHDESFVNEMAYMMVTLHRTGA